MAEYKDCWLSVDERGKYLVVSSTTVYLWIDQHAIPAHRTRRAWKFNKDQVDSWAEPGSAIDHNKRVSGQ